MHRVLTWWGMELEVTGQGAVGHHVLVQLHDLTQVPTWQILHGQNRSATAFERQWMCGSD